METRSVSQELQNKLSFTFDQSSLDKKLDDSSSSGKMWHSFDFQGSSSLKKRPSSRPFTFGLEGRREVKEDFNGDDKNWQVTKVSLTRMILRQLDQCCKRVFNDHIRGLEQNQAEKNAFFNSNIIYLIAATDDNKDALVHSQLVARYTVHFARILGIEDRNFLFDLERGALLHDIGKIGIPESILRKKGPLSEREREIVKDHPVLGYEILEEFDFLKRAAQVVLFHHERYDGEGYPFGLTGEEIPLEARIFALADTLDAITSKRTYNENRSLENALFEIEKGRGSQFDPILTDAFLSIPREKWQQIKAESWKPLPLAVLH